MALIALVIDIAEGHLFPSFGLAHSLLRQGHQVVYVTMPDNEKFVREQGFDFYALYEDIYPKGYRDQVKLAIREQGLDKAMMHGYYSGSVLTDSSGEFLAALHPDLVIISCFLNMEALMLYYKYGIKPVLLTPFLREPNDPPSAGFIQELMRMPGEVSIKLLEVVSELGIAFNSLPELIKPLDECAELILCPQELDTTMSTSRTHTYYIGPFVSGRKSNNSTDFWQDILPGRQLIYASLGSQAAVYANHIFTAFLQALFAVMERADMQSFHLVCSTGIDRENSYKGKVPCNVTLQKWLPQVEVLEKASLAIIHGGLGTVKECIYYGVPMIVIPLVSDQPSNAQRVVHHRLGVQLSAHELTPEHLYAAIQEVYNRKDIPEKVNDMKQLFRDKEAAGEEAEVINRLLMRKVKYDESV